MFVCEIGDPAMVFTAELPWSVESCQSETAGPDVVRACVYAHIVFRRCFRCVQRGQVSKHRWRVFIQSFGLPNVSGLGLLESVVDPVAIDVNVAQLRSDCMRFGCSQSVYRSHDIVSDRAGILQVIVTDGALPYE